MYIQQEYDIMPWYCLANLLSGERDRHVNIIYYKTTGTLKAFRENKI